MKTLEDRQTNEKESVLNETRATTSGLVQPEASDNIAHPDRLGLDELVPSRYALKVGEIDVMVVSDGVLPIPSRVIAHNIDPAVRAAWLEDQFLSPEMLEWPLNVAVVRSGDRTIPAAPPPATPT